MLPASSWILTEDLAGLEIAWALGVRMPPELAQVPIKWDWTSGHNWQAMNLRKLAKGRIQGAFFVNQFSPAYVARKEKVQIRLLPLPLNSRPMVMFYSLRADPAMVSEFERLAAKAAYYDAAREFSRLVSTRSLSNGRKSVVVTGNRLVDPPQPEVGSIEPADAIHRAGDGGAAGRDVVLFLGLDLRDYLRS